METSPPAPSRRKRRSSEIKIFVCHDGEKFGPYTKQDIRKELLSGFLRLSDLAWHHRLENWVPLHELPLRDGPADAKFAMPRLPQEPVPAEEPRRKRKTAAPKPAGGQLKRWFTQVFLGESSPAPGGKTVYGQPEKPKILSSLHRGHLTGMTVSPDKTLILFCKTDQGRSCTVKMPGLLKLLASEFTDRNRIAEVNLYREGDCPNALLEKLTGDAKVSKPLLKKIYSLKESGWMLLHLSSASGCEVLALFDRSASAISRERESPGISGV